MPAARPISRIRRFVYSVSLSLIHIFLLHLRGDLLVDLLVLLSRHALGPADLLTGRNGEELRHRRYGFNAAQELAQRVDLRAEQGSRKQK